MDNVRRFYPLAAIAMLLTGCLDEHHTGHDASMDAKVTSDADAGSPEGGEVDTPDGSPVPAAVATARGNGTGASWTATLDALGGQLTSSDDHFRLTVPAGALKTATEIKVERIENLAHGATGEAYRITPELTFEQPVTLAFRIDDAPDQDALSADVISDFPSAQDPLEDPGALAGEGIATQKADGTWAWMNESQIDATGNWLTVQTRHFSDFAHVPGTYLRASYQEVGVLGEAELTLFACYQFEDENFDPLNDLAPLGYPCRPLNNLRNLTWTVVGGPQNGTITSTGGASALYKAPAKAPKPHLVRVRVGSGKHAPSAFIAVGPCTFELKGPVYGEAQCDEETFFVLNGAASLYAKTADSAPIFVGAETGWDKGALPKVGRKYSHANSRLDSWVFQVGYGEEGWIDTLGNKNWGRFLFVPRYIGYDQLIGGEGFAAIHGRFEVLLPASDSNEVHKQPLRLVIDL